MFVLDTDHLSLLERGDSAHGDLLRARIQGLAASDHVATTIITYEEQTRGWMAELARSRSLGRQVEVYRRLHRQLENYRSLPILEFDEAAAIQFQRLRRLRIRVGTMDLKIASIVLTHNATLLSRNLADFRKVPGLKVEDWTS